MTTDLGRAAGQPPDTVRELLLALLQVVAVAVPVVVLAVLVAMRRWRRLAFVVGRRRPPAPRSSAPWMPPSICPRPCQGRDSQRHLGRVAPVPVAGLRRRRWPPSPPSASPGCRARGGGRPIGRRSCSSCVMALGGTAGVPELLLALAAGATVGAALLVVFGAPNRRPTPADVRPPCGPPGWRSTA